MIESLAAERRIIRVGEFIFHIDVIEDLKARVRAYKSINPKIDVTVFKEITGGLTRKYAIPLLEFLDRERITRAGWNWRRRCRFRCRRVLVRILLLGRCRQTNTRPHRQNCNPLPHRLSSIKSLLK